MTGTAAAKGFFRPMARKALPELDIPIIGCPDCEKRRPMTIKSVVPHLRASEGAEVEYQCTMCGAIERRTVRPVSE